MALREFNIIYGFVEQYEKHILNIFKLYKLLTLINNDIFIKLNRKLKV